jgi:hypothetical protein
MKKDPPFRDKQKAKEAGKKGGRVKRPGTRYFALNREAAAAAGRKSHYQPPKKPKPDYTKAKAFFEGLGGDYVKFMPWEKLGRQEWEYWRKMALAHEKSLVLVEDVGDPLPE